MEWLTYYDVDWDTERKRRSPSMRPTYHIQSPKGQKPGESSFKDHSEAGGSDCRLSVTLSAKRGQSSPWALQATLSPPQPACCFRKSSQTAKRWHMEMICQDSKNQTFIYGCLPRLAWGWLLAAHQSGPRKAFSPFVGQFLFWNSQRSSDSAWCLSQSRELEPYPLNLHPLSQFGR